MRIIFIGIATLFLVLLAPLLVPLQILGLVGYRSWECFVSEDNT